jgi:hypothetical protein
LTDRGREREQDRSIASTASRKEPAMFVSLATTARRTALTAVVAFGVGGAAAALPAASLARPILDTPQAKGCKLNGGNSIRSGSTGRAGGVTYACNDGIACQVEGGRTTRKCSHAAAAIRGTGGTGAGGSFLPGLRLLR